ncbi:lytic murein transglycosylase [Aliiroseovarius sp. CAU 1755]
MVRNSAELEQDFNVWRSSFEERAAEAGISPRTLKLCGGYLQADPRVLEKQSAQAEFTLTICDYLERAVPEARVRKGRARFKAHRDLLNDIATTYKVDVQVIVAIWGIETNYGQTRGDWSVLSALATLAHSGHRSDFFEAELIAALQIIESGDIAPSAMKGSWAGAMGHGQFMPSSFQKYAVDHDGDGRRDIWGTDPTDGLASIANYLAQHGWKVSRPCRIEVALPADFDFALTGRATTRTVGDWTAMGVVAADGAPIPDYGRCSVIVPSGATGPAFMTFENFNVLLTYNRAEAYGIASGYLAERVQGGKRLKRQCPKDHVVLGREGMRELQERLTALGFDTLGADGFSGPNTQSALRAYQTRSGLVPDGFASGEVLDRLRSKTG